MINNIKTIVYHQTLSERGQHRFELTSVRKKIKSFATALNENN
jgi:hypothetical protein